MAERPIYISNPLSKNYVDVENIKFDWYAGFSIKQKQKSIESLHTSFLNQYNNCKILEISSKSPDDIGVKLSAFNLMIKSKKGLTFSVESAFQSSKVFEKGGPYLDILSMSSREAKKDSRLRDSGRLKYFQYFDKKWLLEPKTLFYDWLYINALSFNELLVNEIIKYDAFSDIEFNPEKSINCQARSAALFVSLYRASKLNEALSSQNNYIEVINNQNDINNFKQISIDD